MFKNNAIKKLSLIVASLALILPLASVSGAPVNASAKAPRKTVRIAKRPAAKKSRASRKGHHYYKFAFNKREYRKALKYIAVNKEGMKRLDHKYFSHKSKAYKLGFNDDLMNTDHRNLVNNSQYELGYITADADTIDGKVTPKTLNSAKGWYKEFKKSGPATAPAVDQIKWEAHIDTL